MRIVIIIFPLENKSLAAISKPAFDERAKVKESKIQRK